MKNNLSLEALKAHLFETIEGVKNLSDESASPCEKTSIEQAKAIVAAADSIINIYKVQIEGVGLIAKNCSVASAGSVMSDLGIVAEGTAHLIEQ